MDISSSSTQWIYAAKSGSAINSDSIYVSLAQHNRYGTLNLDLAAAKNSDNTNPFDPSASISTSSQSSSALSSPTNAPGNVVIKHESGLSSGAKAGIGITCVAVAISVLLAVTYFLLKRKRKQKAQDGGQEEPWEKAELDGRVVERKELDGERIHKVDLPHLVHELNARDRPVELEG
jgi:hypothetical protein